MNETADARRPPAETRIELNGRHFGTFARFDPKVFARTLDKHRKKPRRLSLSERERWQREQEARLA